MKLKPNYKLNNVAGKWIIINVSDGTVSFKQLYEINDAALTLWEHLENGCTEQALNDSLAENYPNVPKADLSADIEKFLTELKSLDLLDE